MKGRAVNIEQACMASRETHLVVAGRTSRELRTLLKSSSRAASFILMRPCMSCFRANRLALCFSSRIWPC